MSRSKRWPKILGHDKAKSYKPDKAYRLRVGDYRVLYEVDRPTPGITIYAIRHRREAYR